jgi:hypothetical protein
VRYRTEKAARSEYAGMRPPGAWSHPIALFMFAAECLVHDYLNGRTMPTLVHRRVVRIVEARLVDGTLPVLDHDLCRDVDSEASVLPRVIEAS